MTPPILIVGQGLAGTMLGWELERNGADFQIIDPGPSAGTGSCASLVAAGIVNPITGQRMVKGARIDQLLPLARECYRGLEQAWGLSVWRDMRVRRAWRNPQEPVAFATKAARGELAPFAGAADAGGFWIEQAAQVDVPAILGAARRRWETAGRLVLGKYDLNAGGATAGRLVIDCTGAAARLHPWLGFLPWAVSKGELLRLAVAGLDPGVILNGGHWALPLGEGEAKYGATYTPGATDLIPTAAARNDLVASAQRLLGRPFQVTSHDVGLRLTTPDKLPVAGRIRGDASRGILSGLGSKGVLLAPWLARQWWNHLSEGVPFDPTIDVARFWRNERSVPRN